MIKIDVPLFVVLPRKTKADRKCYLNLNNYRNWHYQVSNQAKQVYCEGLESVLRSLKMGRGINLQFILYKSSKRKIDRSNILSIVEKFFCDALVNYGCIEDDNDDIIESTYYCTGGIDKENPRVEIIITSSDDKN